MREQTWRVDRLNLPEYLRRVEFSGETRPDLATLTALTRAHIDHIPFENLDIPLGRGIDPELDAVVTKLVTNRRGGYCFEHGVLFAAVCERLGFGVARLLARVGSDDRPPQPRTHLTSVVRTEDDANYLVDVGFGSGLLAPLPWIDGVVEQQGKWTFTLVKTERQGWHLRRGTPDGSWQTLQWIYPEPVEVPDVEMANHYVSTLPSSPFVLRAIAVRADEQATYALRGNHYTVTPADGPKFDRELTAAEVTAAWREEFGIPLTDDEVSELVQFSKVSE